MAVRPVFEVIEKAPFVRRKPVEFVFCPGFSMEQRKKNVRNLHSAWDAGSGGRVLEVSRASDDPTGYGLSAFQLTIPLTNGRSCAVECAFQGVKRFERGGPFPDLLEKSPFEAKKDARLRESGRLTGFSLYGRDFPLDPPTFFFDWLYVNTLKLHPECHGAIAKYDAFTDIMFNPERQINCQAEAAAVFEGLRRSGLLEEATADREAFLKIVFGIEERRR